MQPFLKIICPNNPGFTGYAKLTVFKANGDMTGETRIDCPTNPPEPTTMKYMNPVTGGEAKTWRIEMYLSNQSNSHNKREIFNGRYTNQINTTTGKGSVEVDGVTLSGGTGLR
jgi:hypothetical protein